MRYNVTICSVKGWPGAFLHTPTLDTEGVLIIWHWKAVSTLQFASGAGYNAKVTKWEDESVTGQRQEANGRCLDDDRQMATGLWLAGN